MHRKWYGFVLLVLLSGCLGKAPEEKVYRVGVLSALSFFAETTDGFKAKMTELGYVEGRNIVYDVRLSNVDQEAEQRTLEHFVANKVDLILSFPTEASLRAKAVTKGTGIPVVFANVNLQGNALVDSVRQPGANITGVQFPGPDNTLKRFEILHELLPAARRFWVGYERDYPIVPPALALLRPAAVAAGVTLVEVPLSNVDDLQAELQRRSANSDLGMDAILIIPEPLLTTPAAFAILSKFTATHRIPMGGALLPGTDEEPLFGYMTDAFEVGKLAATQAHKIFQGTPAGTIPILSAESRLRINYKQAQKLALPVPEGLLARADDIIR